MDAIKVVVLVLLGLIVTSLGKALFHMSSSPEDSAKMAQALTMRISLSVALSALMLVGYHFGWIQPHGVR